MSLTPSEQVDREIKAYLENLVLTMKVILYSGGPIIRMSFLLLQKVLMCLWN